MSLSYLETAAISLGAFVAVCLGIVFLNVAKQLVRLPLLLLLAPSLTPSTVLA